MTLVEGISQCEQLADAVRRGPLAVDLAFPYHPHVTIAHHLADDQLDQAFDELADFECEFDVEDFQPLRPRRTSSAGRPLATSRSARVPDAACRPSSSASRPASTSCASEHPVVDHALRTQEHYGEAKASQQAGAVTYFGFLSVFPILALAFFVVGYVSKVYPDAQDTLVDAIKSMFPGLIGDGDNQLNIEDIEDAAATAGLIGLVGVLYSGLGWLSALRDALIAVFELPDREQPNFVMGKLRDLITLAIIGVVLLFAVAFTGSSSGFSEDLLDWARPRAPSSAGWSRCSPSRSACWPTRVLFFAMFRLLAAPDLPQARDVVRRPARRGRLRDPQAALDAADHVDPEPAGVPGLRPRADPAGLDQLLLPRHPVRRRVGLDAPAGPRAAGGRARRAGPGPAAAVGRRRRRTQTRGRGRSRRAPSSPAPPSVRPPRRAVERAGRGDDS